MTFANAVRAICSKHPALWPQGLLQMACFIGRNRQFVDVEMEVERWRVEDPAALLDEARLIVLDHGFRTPIFSAHLLKTTTAVDEELVCASDRAAELMLPN